MRLFWRGFMSINERLFRILEEKNMKMVDISNKLEISKSVVSTWKKRGTNPPAEYIERICELLDISIEYLITGKDNSELSKEEKELLKAYRKAEPAIQHATKKLLDIPEITSKRTQGEELSSSRTG